MKKVVFLVLAVCFFSVNIFAEPITKGQARQIAEKWLNKKKPAAKGRMLSAPLMKTDVVFNATNISGDPYIYAVSDGYDGYVIVSGDDRAPSILGYVENGGYDESQMPENMRSWLRHYMDEIELLQKYNLTSPQRTIEDLGEPIAKTTTCLWDQLEPYNAECPMVYTYNDDACTQERHVPLRAVTGCPATALAQVLYVWREEYAKPEVKEGKLIHDIPARKDVIYQSAEKVDDKTRVPVWLKFSDEAIPASTTIDWANLIDVYTERNEEGKAVPGEGTIKGTPEQQAAVARLMHICGAMSEMTYGTVLSGGSGAYAHSALVGLSKYMYFPNARFHQRHMYSTYDGWIKRLYEELKVAKAVYFGGSSSDGGHAFVIDGYLKEDLFHVNWGWSGVANEALENEGYYRINSLLPINQGTGGAVVNDGFRLMQSFYSGVYPNAKAPEDAPAVSTTMLNTFETHADVKQGNLKLTLTSASSNQTSIMITAQTGVALENATGYKQIHPIGEGLSNMTLTEVFSCDTLLAWTGVTDGDYQVRMYYRTAIDGEWAPCMLQDISYIKVHVSNGQATIANSGLFEVELKSHDLKEQYTKGEDINYTLNYKMTKGELENSINATLAVPIKLDENGDYVNDTDRKEAKSMIPTIINAKAGDEVTVTGMLAGADLEVGRYRLLCAGITGYFPTDLEFEVVESADPTGIDLPTTEDNQNTEWYDIHGRKLPQQPTTPGIYVKNGKKVIIK